MPTPGDEEILSIGDQAVDFDLPGADGNSYSLDDFAGYDALLIVFTCNHCPYAKAKIPVLNELAADYEEVAVVGINPNDSEEYPEDSFEEMKAVVESGEVEYDAYLRDRSQETSKAYGAVCTPDPFLFENRDGEFVLAYHGRLDDATNPDAEPTQHDIREAIDTMLRGDSVDGEQIPARGCSIKWTEGNEPDYWN